MLQPHCFHSELGHTEDLLTAEPLHMTHLCLEHTPQHCCAGCKHHVLTKAFLDQLSSGQPPVSTLIPSITADLGLFIALISFVALYLLIYLLILWKLPPKL